MLGSENSQIGSETQIFSYEGALIVDEGGAGGYTTIQGALNDASANDVILVYPGTYVNDTINFTANYQQVIGVGGPILGAVVGNADAAICNVADYELCTIKNLVLTMGTPTTAIDLITTNDGDLMIDNCLVSTIVVATIAAVVQPSLIHITGDGEVLVKNGTLLNYDNDGAEATAAKVPFIIDGDGYISIRDSQVSVSNTGATDITALCTYGGVGALWGELEFNNCTIDVSSVLGTYILGCGYIIGTSSSNEEYRNCKISVSRTNVDAVVSEVAALYVSGVGGASINAYRNNIQVNNNSTNAAGNAYSYSQAGTTTITSYDDNVEFTTVGGTGGTGTYGKVTFTSTEGGVITVGSRDCDYLDIQDAIDVASSGDSIHIYPGTYTGNYTNIDGVSLYGMTGSREDVVLTAATGTVLTVAVGGNSVYRNINITATGTAEAVNIPVGMAATNWVQFWNSTIQSNYGAHADDLITMNSGHLQIINSAVIYVSTGGATTHRILNVTAASTQLYIVNCLLQSIITDAGTNDFTGVELVAGANCNVNISQNAIEIDNDMTSGTSSLYKDLDTLGTTERDIYVNHVHLQGATGATGTAFILDNVVTSLSSDSNIIRVEGFNFNIAANIGASATWDTSFEVLTVDEEVYSGTGTVNKIHTHEAGGLHLDNIDLTGKLNATHDSTGQAVDTLDVIFDTIIQSDATTLGDTHVIDVALSGPLGVTGEVCAVGTHDGIVVIDQKIGAFAVDTVWDYDGGYTDVSGGGAVMNADNDYVYVGGVAVFDEIIYSFTTPSSHSIFQTPTQTWEYSTGAGTWASFSPTDNTLGFRQDGSLLFTGSTLAGWASVAYNGANRYYIRVQRTRNFIGTTPIFSASSAAISALTEYEWDENGDVEINNLTTEENIEVGNHIKAGAISAIAGTTPFNIDFSIQGDIRTVTFITDPSVVTFTNPVLNRVILLIATQDAGGTNALTLTGLGTVNVLSGTFDTTGLVENHIYIHCIDDTGAAEIFNVTISQP